MPNFHGDQIIVLAGAALLLSILLMENDEDRKFLMKLYLQ
jgi:hypothetical protein